MKQNKVMRVLSLIISMAMLIQTPVMADQPFVSISLPIVIVTKITTHPDYFNTQAALKMTSPVVCDMDCDGILEVISAGYNQNTQTTNIYVWQRTGILKSGWPKEIAGNVETTPAVGDLDGDGDLELIVSAANIDPSTGGKIYIWHYDGTLYEGYPIDLDYRPGMPLAGDVSGGFEEEPIVSEYNMGTAVADMNGDGKKEVIVASPYGMEIINGNNINLEGWPVQLLTVGTPVVGDVDGDGTSEVFLAVKTPDANYIYGWKNDGSALPGWPVNNGGVVNAPGNFLTIADINNDSKAEIITGSLNGWIVAWRMNGTVVFSYNQPTYLQQIDTETNEIYQPLVADINNDGNMEIIATSKFGNIYCYNNNGLPINDEPYFTLPNYELSPGAVLADIEMDSLGDPLNPANDLELIFSANDGKVHSIDIPVDYDTNKIQWGMYGYNSRNSDNYLRDWDTAGWFVFDNDPSGATIESIYDWNRGSRVIELNGAGLNNCYIYKKANGDLLNSQNTTLQWAMKYNLSFNIYVSIDTIKGTRYLYYSPTDGNEPQNGEYINHGLGSEIRNGKWHTLSRSLVQDLKDAEPDNEIVDINAIYIQGSGCIDDIMLLPGLPCVDLVNLALSAQVSVSSGDSTKGFINDGDLNTKWVSGNQDLSWVEYNWQNPQKVNKVVIQSLTGANSGVLFITDSNGNVYEVDFTVPQDGGPIQIVFDAIDNVKSIVAVFDNNGMPVSIGEIEVYYDPNVEIPENPPEETYSADAYIKLLNGYFFNPVESDYWIPCGMAYETWNQAVGQWQGPAELRKDLDMMAEIGVNALRADFIWKYIETEDGVYDWTRYDMLLEEAQVRDIKVFPVMTYQAEPEWCPQDWYTMHPADLIHPEGPYISSVLSFENPTAIEKYKYFLPALVTRYYVGGEREDLGDVIAGWIIGNSYTYLNNESMVYDGYDTYSIASFRQWLENKYLDITALNSAWANDNVLTPGYLPNYPYSDFDNVDMPAPFISGEYSARDKKSWTDLLNWREESIANFIVSSVQAVKDIDQHHLVSYSSVALQPGEEDWQYNSEDAEKIINNCVNNGAQLDFWSIKNYPWALDIDGMVTGQSPIEKAIHDTKLPVMVVETGFSTTETLYTGINEDRQAKLVRNTVWESLESGAIGVCVFHWNDRDSIELAEREKGFGIVTADKEPKMAYYKVQEAFGKIKDTDIAQYLVGSLAPVPNIAFLWNDDTDSQSDKYEMDMQSLFGSFEQLGFEPYFINNEELENGDYDNYDAIVLPRNQILSDDVISLLDEAKAHGVKVLENSDLPAEGLDWSARYDWMKANYQDPDRYNLQPKLNISSKYVSVDYRTCSDGSILISFKNIKPDTEQQVSVTTDILAGKIIKNLITDEVIDNNSNGSVQQTIQAEGHNLLFAYNNQVESDFGLDAQVIAQAINPGDSTSFTINVSSINQFNSPVDMSVFGLPDGVSASFSPNPVNADNNSILNISSISSAVPGAYNLRIDGISGPKVHSLNVTLTINDTTQVLDAGDFSLQISPQIREINPGEPTSFAVGIASINQFSSNVTMSVSGIPQGASATFSANPIAPGASQTLNISTQSSVLPGTYELKIEGTSGNKDHNATVMLKIKTIDSSSQVGSTNTVGAVNNTASSNSTNTALVNSVVTTQSSESQNKTDTTNGFTNGPVSIVILEDEDTQTKKSNTPQAGTENNIITPPSNSDKNKENKPDTKSNIGSTDSNKYSNNNRTEQEEAQQQPIEQFQRAIQNNRAEDTGLIRTNPAVVSPAKLQETLKKANAMPVKNFNKPSFDIFKYFFNLLPKFVEWWNGLVKKAQFACKAMPTKYA